MPAKTNKKTRGWIGHRATICGYEFNGHSCTMPPNHPKEINHSVIAYDSSNQMYVLLLDEENQRVQWLKIES